MKTLLFILMCLTPVSCKATKSAADAISDKRVELYALVDDIREIDPKLADELLQILILLEAVGTRVDARDASD